MWSLWRGKNSKAESGETPCLPAEDVVLTRIEVELAEEPQTPVEFPAPALTNVTSLIDAASWWNLEKSEAAQTPSLPEGDRTRIEVELVEEPQCPGESQDPALTNVTSLIDMMALSTSNAASWWNLEKSEADEAPEGDHTRIEVELVDELQTPVESPAENANSCVDMDVVGLPTSTALSWWNAGVKTLPDNTTCNQMSGFIPTVIKCPDDTTYEQLMLAGESLIPTNYDPISSAMKFPRNATCEQMLASEGFIPTNFNQISSAIKCPPNATYEQIMSAGEGFVPTNYHQISSALKCPPNAIATCEQTLTDEGFIPSKQHDIPANGCESKVVSQKEPRTFNTEPDRLAALSWENVELRLPPAAQPSLSSTEQSESLETTFNDEELQKNAVGEEATVNSSSDDASSLSCSTSFPSESEGMNKRALWNQRAMRFADQWKALVTRNGNAITVVVTTLALQSAKNPYICIFSLAAIAIILPLVGAFTNFTLVLDNGVLWLPNHSPSVHQMNWMYEQTRFTFDYRYVNMIVHANGGTVLTREGISRVFDAMSIVADMEQYQLGCNYADLVGDAHQVGECHVQSVANFWNASRELFEEEILTDKEARRVLSSQYFPTGETVDLPRLVGNFEVDAGGTLTQAQSFLIEFELPWSYDTADFEWQALQKIFDVQSQWREEENNPFRLEVTAFRSYEDEFMRSIVLDLPLMPTVFIVVCIFCGMVFWERDKVRSRCLLGIGSVVTILLSIMTSFGIMFICGVPFTTSTTMLPFLMFGVGLDDTFIIMGSYNRTHGTDTLKRLEVTMKDISVSIFITSLTSTVAFTLGCFSQIPAVAWLCIYAGPSIVIDFFFQITFFIALLALDERRIQANRRDCCICIHAGDIDKGEHNNMEGSKRTPNDPGQRKHWTDQLMTWYADKLLHPVGQFVVMAVFLVLLAGSIKAVTNLEQKFDMNDMVPRNSYLRDYYSSIRHFSATRNGIPSYAFFRDVDQSDPFVQQQMLRFVDDLAETGAIAARPSSFWLRDFLNYTNSSDMASEVNLTFREQVERFLAQPLYNDLYDDHLNFDTNGIVNASRCEIYVDVDISDAKGGVAALERLRSVARTQPMNAGLDSIDWKVFTYHDLYNLWEFYTRVLKELSSSTTIGIIAVSVVGLLLIPHWSAVFYVGIITTFLYVDLLGYISYTGVNVNAISYIQLVMSIGLMVDYIMHVLIRYYECSGTRRERVKETLETMGVSIFWGCFSSLLAVSLLVFSTSKILQLVFVVVLGLVLLGILYALVFLPVILSLIGPQ